MQYTTKKELILKRYFKFFTAVFLLILLILHFQFEFYHKGFVGFRGFIIILMISLYVSFVVMFYQMRKHHNFEYKRIRKSMLVFISSFTVWVVVDFFVFSTARDLIDINSLINYT